LPVYNIFAKITKFPSAQNADMGKVKRNLQPVL